MKNKIIFICGAPSTGKSTYAAQLFVDYKKLLNTNTVELVQEYPRELVYDKSDLLDCQLFSFTEGYKRIYKLLGKVNCLIVDAPFFLATIYSTEKLNKHLYNLSITLLQYILEKKYDIEFHMLNDIFENNNLSDNGRRSDINNSIKIMEIKFLVNKITSALKLTSNSIKNIK